MDHTQTKEALVDEKSLQSPYGNIFNTKDIGAVGDSLVMDTKSIQNAINACNANCGGTI
jgi:polygalacturonase